MSSEDIEDQTIVSVLSKKLVAEVAPEELDMFDELLAEYFQNPEPPNLTRSKNDDALGSGLGIVMAAVTPAAAAISNLAVRFIEKTLQTKDHATPEQTRVALQKRLEPSTAPATPILDTEQLEQLRQVTLSAAAQYGMNHFQAEQLTNAIVVSLVLGRSAATTMTKPITILFLAANPIQLDRLAVDREVRLIDNALRASAQRDSFRIEQHWSVRIEEFQSLLLRTEPDILHFSGHGGKTGGLMLDTQEGEPYPIPSDALSDLFRLFQDGLRCVILNACYSAEQAQAISKHIPCVVGMSSQVDDASAIAFSAAFYQALAYGRTVSVAFELAVSELKLEKSHATTAPRLLLRDEAASQLRFA